MKMCWFAIACFTTGLGFAQTWSFDPPVALPYGASSFASAVASGDMNLDGHPDVVVVSSFASEVSIYWGDGHGGLEPEATLAAGPARAVEVVDVNRDCIDDILVKLSHSILAYLSDGQGGFSAPVQSITPGPSPWLIARDFDNDGIVDVAVPTLDVVHLLRGDGSGAFAFVGTYPAGFNANGVDAGDFDEDGWLDLVITHALFFQSNVTVLLGGPNGFALAETFSSQGDYPKGVVVGDFDEDVHLDFFVADDCIGALHFYRGDGTGDFTRIYSLDFHQYHDLVAADVDGDGHLDLLAHTNCPSSDLQVYLGDGQGGLSSPSVVAGGRGWITVADFDSDGSLDAALAHQDLTLLHNGAQWAQSPVNAHWYKRTGRMDWLEAELLANSWGGHLATIRSAAENDWLRTTFGWVDSFVGYTDVHNEGTWVWTSGEPSPYTNWRPGEPDNVGETDFGIVDASTGEWRDVDLMRRAHGIAEVASDDCDQNGIPDVYELAVGLADDVNGDGILDACTPPNYCVANPNSAGVPALLSLTGFPAVGVETLEFHVTGLPPNRFGYFLMSQLAGFVPLFGGSQGNLCLDLPIVRFAGDILDSGAAGEFHFAPDFTSLPSGQVIELGETWNFQSWYRDANPAPTSNTSDAVSVTFSADPRPFVSFAVACASVEEESIVFDVAVELSWPYHEDVTLPFGEAGTADFPTDWFFVTPSPLVIPVGNTSGVVQVAIVDDADPEADETAGIVLGAPTNARRGDRAAYLLSILDDD
ncbi:MAG: hypothetical protein GY711_35565 [bacterium]|nr:hypothetical protein [bacterium]